MNKTMNKIVLSFLFLFFLYTLCAQKIIDIEDYELKTGQDVTPLLRSIIENNRNNVTIRFTKGIYHFYPQEAFGKYHAITNHDNLYRYFAFPLIDLSGIEIDGGGSEFIFHGQITPFLLERSKNIKLHNFSIDWEQPFFFQAEVVESNKKEKTMDLRVNPAVEPLFEGHRLGFVTNGLHFPFLGESMVFDPKTKAVAYNAVNYVLNTVTSRFTTDTQLDKNTFRIQWDLDIEPPVPGMLYVSKGPNKFNRYCPGIHLSDSKDIMIENVVIHHAGGMGIIGEKTENIHIKGVQVVLREGTDRILTTTADATHFCNCKGQLLIEDCLFMNMLDDATNIHGSYLRVYKKKDATTLLSKINHFQQFDYHFAQPGDSISFIDKETLLSIGSGKVKEIKVLNEQVYEISFTEPLPEHLKLEDGLDNITWYPETIFRNNTILNNRARGILISTRNKTLIYNNTFSSMMAAILFEGDMNFWYEAGAVNHVEIKNNVFLDNAYGGNKMAVIQINPRMKKVIPDRSYERNILIENNEFRTFDNPILSAHSVDGLVFSGNKIKETNTYPKLFPDAPAINLKSCINTTIQSNTYEGKNPVRIEVDSSTRQSLFITTGQKGFIY